MLLQKNVTQYQYEEKNQKNTSTEEKRMKY